MAGGMLSQSLKGVSLGGFVSGFGGPAFCGMKALQKESTARKVLQPLEPLGACE